MNKMIDANEVQKVYSGVDGKCCCGCAGKHIYCTKYRDAASKYRGYVVTDDEVNDKSFMRIINKMNKNIDSVADEGSFYSLVIGKRLYVAYKVKRTF